MPGVHGRGGRGGFGRFRGFDWTQGRSSWTTDYPAVGPPFLGGAAALDARARAVGRGARQPGRRRRVRLAVALRRGSGPLEPDRRAGQGDAGVSAARRILHVRRFPRDGRVGGLHASMQRVFPDRPIVEIDSKDPIFHTIYDLDDRFQVPGEQYVRSHRTYEYDGVRAALARDLRRQRPADGGHLLRHGPGRFLGACGQSAISARSSQAWESASASTTWCTR